MGCWGKMCAGGITRFFIATRYRSVNYELENVSYIILYASSSVHYSAPDMYEVFFFFYDFYVVHC